MNKWALVALGTVIGLAIVLGGFSLVRQKEIVSPLSQESQPTPSVGKAPSKILKEYQDASGFRFNYPEDLIITEKKLSKDAYANLEITSAQVSGSISLKAVDSSLRSLNDWFLENKEATLSARKIRDIKLADIKAKEIKKQGEILTIALDQGGVFFSIKTLPQKEKDFWLSAYNTLISSFSFALPEDTTTSKQAAPANSSGDIIFEGEEIIE